MVALVVGWAAIARADTVGYEIKIPERIEVVPGAVGELSIELAIDRGYSISKDAGIILDVAPDGGLVIAKHRLGRGDAVDPDADSPRFKVVVHAEAAGDYAIKVHARFWVCGAKTCRPIDIRRSVAVTVVAPK